MKNTFSQRIKSSIAMFGKVAGINNGKISVWSAMDINNIKIVAPFGMTSKPKVGDDSVILPLDDGSFVLLGNIVTSENKALGEVKFENSAGAYIKLKQNGDVEINSMIIAPDGTIK